MAIGRDECNERQTRVDRMIDEFRKAQSRRLAKTTPTRDDSMAEPQRGAHDRAAPDSTVRSEG